MNQLPTRSVASIGSLVPLSAAVCTSTCPQRNPQCRPSNCSSAHGLVNIAAAMQDASLSCSAVVPLAPALPARHRFSHRNTLPETEHGNGANITALRMGSPPPLVYHVACPDPARFVVWLLHRRPLSKRLDPAYRPTCTHASTQTDPTAKYCACPRISNRLKIASALGSQICP
jgi:hypothetical protein